MESLIIYLIVGSAVLYLCRWFYANVVVHEDEEASCSGCDSCETSAKPATPGVSGAVKS